MKIKGMAREDLLLLAGNITVALIVFIGVYLMNMKGIGKGSQPMFAIPFALMVSGMYLVCFLMFEEVKSKKIKWLILGFFGVFSLSYLIWVLGM